MNLIKMLEAYAEEKGFGPRIHIIEEMGFAIYHLSLESCYIEEIYVVPQLRHSGIAKKMADEISVIAKERGIRTLVGSVSLKARGKDASIKVLLAYGMELAETNGDMIYLKKEI